MTAPHPTPLCPTPARRLAASNPSPSRWPRRGLAALVGLALLAGLPLAQADRDGGRDGWRDGWREGGGRGGARDGWLLDNRFHHDHYYPARGYYAPALPLGSVSLVFGGSRFYYGSGIWFRPVGPRYVVVSPPLGIVVPVLPPDAVALWGDGPGGVDTPYYYANGAYYAPTPGGYAVVLPPRADGLRSAPGGVAPSPLPMSPAPVAVAPAPVAKPVPVIAPRDGQTAQQTEADRQECNRWATTQPSALADADLFQRATAACMDARGYTVR